MTIKTSASGSLSLTEIATEYQDTKPYYFSWYYAGSPKGLVPAGTVGYPGGVATNIPSSGQLKFSNFYGSKKYVATSWFLGTMFSIQSAYNNADDLYFGGQIPRWSPQYRDSTNYITVTTPNSTDTLYLASTVGWAAQFAAGWTQAGGWNGAVYYDEISQPGLRVYRVSDGAYMGGVNGQPEVVNFNNSWGIRYCNTSLRIQVAPNTQYRVHYSAYFNRPSNIGYGDQSFGWYDYIRPNITVTNY
jgi:hypothetical protein